MTDETAPRASSAPEPSWMNRAAVYVNTPLILRKARLETAKSLGLRDLVCALSP